MKKIIFLLMLVVCANVFLQAQVPSPTNLTVGQNPGTVGAYLHWEYAANVGSFKVFRAKDSAEFVYRGTAQMTSYIDVEVLAGHIYRYYVRAYVNGAGSEPSNIVTFIPSVPSPVTKGIVAGSVLKDVSGEPLAGAWLRFVRPGNQYATKEVTIGESGNYLVALDTGTYQIHAQKQGYSAEWFDNKPTRDNADIIIVEENDTLHANFSLAPLPPPQRGMIAGAVLKESDQSPIVGAKIFFYTPNANQAIKFTYTDSAGNYYAELTAGSYCVQAKREGFVAEWFDNKLERSDADVVIVENNQTATANFQLAIVPAPVSGMIGGTVVDEITLQPIVNATIGFYNSNGSGGLMLIAHTDSSGMFQAEIPTGVYKVRAEKQLYIAEWFDNKYEMSQADPVTVSDNGIATTNFALTAVAPVATLHIAGTVTDSLGNPLANAQVAVIRSMSQYHRARRMLGANALTSENIFIEGYGRMYGVVWHGITDENGNYNAGVPAGRTYIVFARKGGYYPEFYNDKQSMHDADKLRLNNDTSGINFSLAVNPNVQNSIAGMVKDSSGVGILAHVVLVKFREGRWRSLRHISTDSMGNYSFANVWTGNYLVRAFPVVGFAPAWYDAGNCGTSDWHSADTVLISGNVTGIDICVVVAGGNGFAHINGTVRDNMNAIKNGVVVLAVSNSDNSIVGFDVTEKDGAYEMDNLLPGSYHISIDCEGYAQESELSVVLNAANQFHATNINVKLLPESPLGIENEVNVLPPEFSLLQNYPNPFNPQTAIGFSLLAVSNVTLRVYDMLGREVAVLIDNERRDAGKYSVKFDATYLQSGIYISRLTAGNFTKTKKMILMK